MRRRGIISWMLAVLMIGSSVQAQTGDWQAVQNLAPGTRISVRAGKTYLCFLQSATADGLVCEQPFRPHSPMTLPRGEIREVRLVASQAKALAIGAGVGAGVGAAVGASTSGSSRGARAFVGALGGALIGSTVGGVSSIFHRGRTIYKR